jgi:signal transduction histidine kinase
MKRVIPKHFFPALPYIGLLIFLSGTVWAFVQSDSFRIQTSQFLTEKSEFQWRAGQAREALIRLTGYIELSAATGNDLHPDAIRQTMLAQTNIAQILALSYLPTLIDEDQIALLEQSQHSYETAIMPTILSEAAASEALSEQVRQLTKNLATTPRNHATQMMVSEQIRQDIARNWIYLWLALGPLALIYVIIYRRYSYLFLQDKQIRAFASLFVHMTRSRVTALRMFLDNVNGERPPNRAMVIAARSAALELEGINDDLHQIAHSKSEQRTEVLGELMGGLAQNNAVDVVANADAVHWHVPASAVSVVLDELVQNALAAVEQIEAPKVAVKAAIKRPTLPFQSPILLLQVTDNGVGMPPEIVEKATMPFFSTKAGEHSGLGLTSCVQMATSLGGKLTIVSKPGIGTTIRVRIPLPRAARFSPS